MGKDLASMRRGYRRVPLDERRLPGDPLVIFDEWFDEAVASGAVEPNAMVLATADESGRPSARIVLLKGVDERGFAFYTNLESRKARELAANPQAALCLGWLELERQVRVEGTVEPVEREESEAYWGSRPRESQLSAWASPQSSVVASRADLERGVAEIAARFGDVVPLPEFWGGLRVVPESVEFWQGGPGRLHDRLRFRRAGDGWTIERLGP
ncbi:MAG TPA: pyridoxamine 5'-phosphate oxidase [Jiangellaceae bacterium]